MSILNASSATLGLDYQSLWMVPGDVIDNMADQTIKEGDGTSHFAEVFNIGWQMDYFGSFSNYVLLQDAGRSAEYPQNALTNLVTASYQGKSFYEWSGLSVDLYHKHNNNLSDADENRSILVGNDTIIGGSAADNLAGFDGDDKIKAGKSNDIIDGGTGTDTAYYQGARSDYRLDKTANGYTLTALTSNAVTLDGTDQLSNIEYLQFKDGTLKLADQSFVTIKVRS